MTSYAFVAPFLARGGRVVGARRGRFVATLDVVSGRSRRWPLPIDANGLVLSPDGQLLLATTLGGVATLDAAGDVVGEAATEGPAAWAATTDDGFVVAIDRHDVEGPSIYAWRGSPLVPIGEAAPLGEVIVEGVDVHAKTSTALVWGVLGRGGTGAAGERFVSLVSFADDDAEVVWSGGGLPIEPTRWWLIAGGGIVAHDRHRIVTMPSPADDRRPAEPPVVAVDELATSNVSPDGTRVAWANRVGHGLTVRSVALPGGEVRTHGELPADVQDEVIAVADTGEVTVAAAIDQDEVEVWRSAGKELRSVGRLRAKD